LFILRQPSKRRGIWYMNIRIAAIFGPLLLSLTPCHAIAVPVSNLTAVTAAITRDFSNVDEIRTVHLGNDADERLDFVVVGFSRLGEFKIEILRLEHRRIVQKWNSSLSTRNPEFEVSGPKSVNVYASDEDYEVVVEGCARHMCSDGISGFLVFSGKEGKSYEAKLVAHGLDRSPTDSPRYDVTFSRGITLEARKTLEDAICSSFAVTFKKGLPFPCKQ
jgi:hypothetical protein